MITWWRNKYMGARWFGLTLDHRIGLFRPHRQMVGLLVPKDELQWSASQWAIYGPDREELRP